MARSFFFFLVSVQCRLQADQRPRYPVLCLVYLSTPNTTQGSSIAGFFSFAVWSVVRCSRPLGQHANWSGAQGADAQWNETRGAEFLLIGWKCQLLNPNKVRHRQQK